MTFEWHGTEIFQQDQISHLRDLSSLNLSYNNIASDLRGLLDNNINLEEFNIRNNVLRLIDENIFQVSFSYQKNSATNHHRKMNVGLQYIHFLHANIKACRTTIISLQTWVTMHYKHDELLQTGSCRNVDKVKLCLQETKKGVSWEKIIKKSILWLVTYKFIYRPTVATVCQNFMFSR